MGRIRPSVKSFSFQRIAQRRCFLPNWLNFWFITFHFTTLLSAPLPHGDSRATVLPELHLTFIGICFSSCHCIGDRWWRSTGQGLTGWGRLGPRPFLCTNQIRTALDDIARLAGVSDHIFLQWTPLNDERIWYRWRRTTRRVFTAWEVRAPSAIGFTGDLGGSQDLEAFEAPNLSCLSTTEICPINSSTLNGWWGALARQAGRWAATPGAIRETLS